MDNTNSCGDGCGKRDCGRDRPDYDCSCSGYGNDKKDWKRDPDYGNDELRWDGGPYGGGGYDGYGFGGPGPVSRKHGGRRFLCVLLCLAAAAALVFGYFKWYRNPGRILTKLDDSAFTEQVELVGGTLIFHESGDLFAACWGEWPDGEIMSVLTVTAQGALPALCDESLEMDSTFMETSMYVGTYGQGSYFAQFMYEDTGYYIAQEDVTQTEFISSVCEIIQG